MVGNQEGKNKNIHLQKINSYLGGKRKTKKSKKKSNKRVRKTRSKRQRHRGGGGTLSKQKSMPPPLPPPPPPPQSSIELKSTEPIVPHITFDTLPHTEIQLNKQMEKKYWYSTEEYNKFRSNKNQSILEEDEDIKKQDEENCVRLWEEKQKKKNKQKKKTENMENMEDMENTRMTYLRKCNKLFKINRLSEKKQKEENKKNNTKRNKDNLKNVNTKYYASKKIPNPKSNDEDKRKQQILVDFTNQYIKNKK